MVGVLIILLLLLLFQRKLGKVLLFQRNCGLGGVWGVARSLTFGNFVSLLMLLSVIVGGP